MDTQTARPANAPVHRTQHEGHVEHQGRHSGNELTGDRPLGGSPEAVSELSAHAEPEARRAPWSPERILASGTWRARQRIDSEPGAASPLELIPQSSLGERFRRALSVPVLAGAAVFVLAVLVAITMTLLQNHAADAAGSGKDRAGATSARAGEVQGSSTGRESTGSPESGSPKPASDRVFVHVIGEVARPGVFELESGKRVTDAIAAAGGATEAAVLGSINLARVVEDGEQIVVPDSAALAAAGTRGGLGGDTGAAPPTGQGSKLVNLNVADSAALESLSGVGPALAGRIIAWREENGPFTDTEQLLDVPGIGAKTLDRFRDQVTVR